MTTFKHCVGQEGTAVEQRDVFLFQAFHTFDEGEKAEIIDIEDNGISEQHYLCRSSETGDTQWLTEEQFIPKGEV